MKSLRCYAILIKRNKIGGTKMKLFKSDKVFVWSLFIAAMVQLVLTILFKDIAVALVPTVISYFIAKAILNSRISEDF